MPGARGVAYVEREAAAAAKLVHRMETRDLAPAPVWSDLATFDARPWRGRVHCVASGDPCQGNSVAGTRLGVLDDRFLIDQVIRVVNECRPLRVFRENVPGNSDGQLAALVPALERLGYRVEVGIFSSAETRNVHGRQRMFVMADTLGHFQEGRVATRGEAPRRRAHGQSGGSSRALECAELADAGSARLQGCELGGSSGGQHGITTPRPAAELRRALSRPLTIPGPTDSRWIDILDRWPELQPAFSKEEAESHIRRGFDALADRVDRLRLLGNGVDPVAAAYAWICLDAAHRAHRERSAGVNVLRSAA